VESAEQYAYGTECTWHGPLTFTALGKTPDGWDVSVAPAACPKCGQPLKTTTADEFWHGVKQCDRHDPGHEALMRWSEGKCFPDFDTLQNAYRQAMEGTL